VAAKLSLVTVLSGMIALSGMITLNGSLCRTDCFIKVIPVLKVIILNKGKEILKKNDVWFLCKTNLG
jgi:hypothetical protein